MMSRRAQDNLVAVVILLLFGLALFLSFEYGPRARMVPVPITLLCIALLVAQMVWQNMRPDDDLHIDTLELFTGRSSEDVSTPEPKAESEARPTGLKRWAQSEPAAFLLVALLLLAFLTLGPIIAVFLFTWGYFVLSGHCSWLRGLAYAVACTGILYVMFGVVLDVDLNRGWAMPYINQIVRF